MHLSRGIRFLVYGLKLFKTVLPTLCMGERTCSCETACRSLHWQPVQYTPKSYDLADASFLHAE